MSDFMISPCHDKSPFKGLLSWQDCAVNLCRYLTPFCDRSVLGFVPLGLALFQERHGALCRFI